VPDDVQALAHAVLQHRLQLAAPAGSSATETVVADALAQVAAR
jgi:hypothetical protein